MFAKAINRTNVDLLAIRPTEQMMLTFFGGLHKGSTGGQTGIKLSNFLPVCRHNSYNCSPSCDFSLITVKIGRDIVIQWVQISTDTVHWMGPYRANSLFWPAKPITFPLCNTYPTWLSLTNESVGVGGCSKVVATFDNVGGSFDIFMATTQVIRNPSFWIWGYVLQVEYIWCVITNCGQH